MSSSVKTEITCIAFSPTNPSIIAVATGNRTTITTIDNRPSPQQSYVQHNSAVVSCAFFPDGKSILSAAMDGEIRILNLETHKVTNNLTCDEPIRNVLVAPNGTYFLIVTKDGSILVRRPWYFGTWAQRYLKKGRRYSTILQSVAISPDSRSVVSITEDDPKTIEIINVETRKTLLVSLDLRYPITSVTYVCGGKFLLVTTTGKTCYIFEATTGAEIKFIDGFSSIRELVCSPDERYIAVLGRELTDGSAPVRDGLWLLDFGQPHLGTLTEEEALIFV